MVEQQVKIFPTPGTVQTTTPTDWRQQTTKCLRNTEFMQTSIKLCQGHTNTVSKIGSDIFCACIETSDKRMNETVKTWFQYIDWSIRTILWTNLLSFTFSFFTILFSCDRNILCAMFSYILLLISVFQIPTRFCLALDWRQSSFHLLSAFHKLLDIFLFFFIWLCFSWKWWFILKIRTVFIL